MADSSKSNPNQHTYMMLSRLQGDNDYFLGAGGGSERSLWAKNVDAQITEMKKLWNSLPEDSKPEWLSMEDISEYEEKMKQNPKEYVKGGGVKKFPIALQRRIDEINEMLPQVLDSDDIAGGYQGSTMYSYIELKKPIEIKNNFVYLNAKVGSNNYPFEKRYNVNNRDDNSDNGRKSLMYDLGIINKAFKKLLADGSTYSEGGRIKKMVESWQEEGRSFSKIDNDDTDFFKNIGISSDEIATTSQTGSDIVYYNDDIWDGGTKRKNSSTYADGGGVHVMPNGEIMPDSAHYAKGGSIKRLNRSPLLRYTNFEDGWFINLVRLNPYKNQNGLKYKGNNNYGISRQSKGRETEIWEFETLDSAHEKYYELVTLGKTYSKIAKEGEVKDNYIDVEFSKGGSTFAEGGDVGVKYYHGSRHKFDDIESTPIARGESMFLGDGIYITNDKSVAKEYANGNYLYEITLSEPLESLPFKDALSKEQEKRLIERFEQSNDSELNYHSELYQDVIDDGDDLWGKSIIADLERNDVDVNQALISAGFNAIESPLNLLNQFRGRLPDSSRNINIIKKGILTSRLVDKKMADGGEIFEYKVKQYSKNHTIKELSEIQDKLLKTKNISKAQQENLIAISTAIGVKRNPDFYKDKMSKGGSTYADGGSIKSNWFNGELSFLNW
jgi:hypothetical protein